MKYLIAVLSLLCFSCLPDRLVPYDYSIEKNNQEAYIELDSITIAITNLEVKNDHSVFMLEVENLSSQPLFIDIEKINKYASLYSHSTKPDKEIFSEVTAVMTPSQINQFFKAKRNKAQATAFFLFLVGAAVSTMDAVKDNKDNRKFHWTNDDQRKSEKRDLLTGSTLIATDILADVALTNSETAATELNYLPAELFKRKIIYPGERFNGKILFKQVGLLK
ncbi:hypothetical protein [Ekhidna sp.]